MKYDYQQIQNEVEHFLLNNSDDYFYVTDIVKELGYSAYVIDKVLKHIDTDQIMSYTSEKLVYVYKGKDKEKQIPQSFVDKFLSKGWSFGRCDSSKRAICIAEGGNPDKVPMIKIHKNYENKEVNESELQHYIENGWVVGYINVSTLGKVAVHKDDVDKYVFPHEVSTYIEQGWLEGGKEKRNLRDYSNVWNKDKTKETDPRLMSISQKVSEYNLNMPQEQRIRTSISVSNLWSDSDYRKNQIARRIGRIPWNKGKKGAQSWTENQRNKCNETKRKNKTFNTSKPEEDYYKYLLQMYKPEEIIRQYRDERYPFNCDFYITSEDRFIELNGHWTHGEEPYNETNPEHERLLNIMREKSMSSNYYKIAINVWTKLDVQKKQTAIKNNLNYEVIYGINKNQRCYRISSGELHQI